MSPFTSVEDFSAPRALERLLHRKDRTIGVRQLMLLLSLILVLPGLVFLGFITARMEDERRELIVAVGTRIADDFADRLDAEIASTFTLLDIFSRSGWLEEDELELMYRRARSALSGKGLHLIVLDEEGSQLFNTRVPFGTPLGQSSDEQALAAARGEEHAEVSDFFYGRVAQTAVYNVINSVELADGRRRTLIITRNIDSLSALAEKGIEAGWELDLRDSKGNIALESDRSLETATSACEPDADHQYAVEKKLVQADWTVCARSKNEALLLPRARQGAAMHFAGTIWVCLTLAIAFYIGRLLSREIGDISQVAAGLQHGSPGRPAKAVIREVSAIQSSLCAVSRRLSDREAERRMILSETKHRARNQMALAVSLANMLARQTATAAELKSALVPRLIALGRAVEIGEASAGARVSLQALVETQLAPFKGEQLDTLSLAGKLVRIKPEAAQSLSLVFHELATNSQKYGAWSVPDGSVAISWHQDDSALSITWTEQGKKILSPSHKGFGSTLLTSIVENALDGRLKIEFRDVGLICTMQLPLPNII